MQKRQREYSRITSKKLRQKQKPKRKKNKEALVLKKQKEYEKLTEMKTQVELPSLKKLIKNNKTSIDKVPPLITPKKQTEKLKNYQQDFYSEKKDICNSPDKKLPFLKLKSSSKSNKVLITNLARSQELQDSMPDINIKRRTSLMDISNNSSNLKIIKEEQASKNLVPDLKKIKKKKNKKRRKKKKKKNNKKKKSKNIFEEDKSEKKLPEKPNNDESRRSKNFRLKKSKSNFAEDSSLALQVIKKDEESSQNKIDKSAWKKRRDYSVPIRERNKKFTPLKKIKSAESDIEKSSKKNILNPIPSRPKRINIFQAIVPTNLAEEKEKFFECKDRSYNPQFKYKYKIKKIPFSKPHKKYKDKAIKILELAKADFGGQKEYLGSFGEKISVEEFQEEFDSYIKELKVEKEIKLTIKKSYTPAPYFKSRSDVTEKHEVVIGLPIKYRKERVRAFLDHEVGVHFLRTYNEYYQPWFRKRKEYDLYEFITSEEGMGAIVELVEEVRLKKRKPYMYLAAAYYYAACRANELSFCELFKEMMKYMDFEPTCFSMCYRVKRGLKDTAEPGSMARDQMYFLGAVNILKSRKILNFKAFMSGKLSLADTIRLDTKKTIEIDRVKMPKYLKDEQFFKQALEKIIESNQLDF